MTFNLEQMSLVWRSHGAHVKPLTNVYVLGHFYFTKLLLPTLIATAKSAPDGKARVITTSSSAHTLSGLNFDTFKDSPARKELSDFQLYGQSKNAR